MNRYESLIVKEFHTLFYNGPAHGQPLYANTSWMGVPCLKCPLDLWVYQEMLNELRPDLIVETGTFAGGSALYLAHLCDLLGRGDVVTVDIEQRERPAHPRVTYLTGSSVDPDVLDQVRSKAHAARKVMVILDSDHSFEHVRAELEHYSGLVSEDSYLVVEDTNLSGHPVHPENAQGPLEAVRQFLERHPEFAPDLSREKYLMTFNPGGYLRRTGSAPAAGAAPEDAGTAPLDAGDEVVTGPVVVASLVALLEQMTEQRARMASDLSTATGALVEAVSALSKIGAHGISLNEALAAELGRVFELGGRLGEMMSELKGPRRR
jgi:cephalosporin hydroxylase